MANIGGLLGTAGGANGTGFAGPQNAAILTPTTAGQATEQYNNAQDALSQQRGFLQQMQQGGQNASLSQMGLLDRLQQASQGNGPNPALAQLNQTTGQNVANQAALMAGQRGSGANAGMMARQAAQQGATTQQQAAGQAATLSAQQQMAYMQQLQAQQQAMIGQQSGATNAYNTAAQNEQSNILNALAGQNNARVGMQSNVNNANAGLIGQTMGQQASIGSSMAGAASSMMGGLAEGGEVGEDEVKSNGGVQAGSAPNIGSVSMTPMPSGGKSSGGGGGGGIAGLAAMLAPGGQVGSSYMPLAPMGSINAGGPSGGPQSFAGQFLGNPQASNGGVHEAGSPNIGSVSMSAMPGGASFSKKTSSGEPTDAGGNEGSGGEGGGGGGSMNAPKMLADGGKVPALLSPGERYLSPDQVNLVKQGKADPIKDGQKVPGKPKVGGAKNSYANDTVKAELEEGGIVIPRSITQGKNPHWESMKFVHATLAKNRHK